MGLELKNLYDDFRDPDTIKAYAAIIAEDAKKLTHPINIMEVCGGHTHTIMKYGVLQEQGGKWTLLNADSHTPVAGLDGIEGFDIFIELMRKDKDIEFTVRREILAGAGVACRYT